MVWFLQHQVIRVKKNTPSLDPQPAPTALVIAAWGLGLAGILGLVLALAWAGGWLPVAQSVSALAVPPPVENQIARNTPTASPTAFLPFAKGAASEKTAGSSLKATVDPTHNPFSLRPAQDQAVYFQSGAGKRLYIALVGVDPLPTATPTETPEPSPTPLPDLPDSAEVDGLSGYNQSLPLSCESRSAVDWARFFGVEIAELEFQYALPFTDNPETGFVGNPRDAGGGVPPHSYGVYAGPVAELLRSYGVSAQAYRAISYDDLRREIAAGRPVIVWVIGRVWSGVAQGYTSGDGSTTTVASGEHTVIVAGYGPDTVTIQDGGQRYTVSKERFLESWGVLDYQAVMSQ